MVQGQKFGNKKIKLLLSQTGKKLILVSVILLLSHSGKKKLILLSVILLLSHCGKKLILVLGKKNLYGFFFFPCNLYNTATLLK